MVIAHDFTGASDIANTLTKGIAPEDDLRAAQFPGIPDTPAPPDIEAGVVSLKSRTAPRDQAVADSVCPSPVTGSGMRADRVQVLLDVRLHQGRKHRPGRRSFGERAECGPCRLLPSIPDHRTNGLSRDAFCWGQAAQRVGDGKPPAHAHDGRGHSAVAGASNAGVCGAPAAP